MHVPKKDGGPTSGVDGGVKVPLTIRKMKTRRTTKRNNEHYTFDRALGQ